MGKISFTPEDRKVLKLLTGKGRDISVLSFRSTRHGMDCLLTFMADTDERASYDVLNREDDETKERSVAALKFTEEEGFIYYAESGYFVVYGVGERIIKEFFKHHKHQLKSQKSRAGQASRSVSEEEA